jgi:hypothetical protein
MGRLALAQATQGLQGGQVSQVWQVPRQEAQLVAPHTVGSAVQVMENPPAAFPRRSPSRVRRVSRLRLIFLNLFFILDSFSHRSDTRAGDQPPGRYLGMNA